MNDIDVSIAALAKRPNKLSVGNISKVLYETEDVAMREEEAGVWRNLTPFTNEKYIPT